MEGNAEKQRRCLRLRVEGTWERVDLMVFHSAADTADGNGNKESQRRFFCEAVGVSSYVALGSG